MSRACRAKSSGFITNSPLFKGQVILVSTTKGLTVCIKIPLELYSAPTAAEKLRTKALEAAYIAKYGQGRLSADEEMLMMMPLALEEEICVGRQSLPMGKSRSG